MRRTAKKEGKPVSRGVCVCVCGRTARTEKSEIRGRIADELDEGLSELLGKAGAGHDDVG